MVGEGPEREKLTRQARGLGVEENFIFTGFRKDVSRLLSSADLLVMPSTNEGFGISIVEAMALSIPVVGTRVGGVMEVMKDGVTGLLVPPGDPGAIAGACIDILKRPDRARAIGQAGRERAKRLFDTGESIRNFRELYREIYEESP